MNENRVSGEDRETTLRKIREPSRFMLTLAGKHPTAAAVVNHNTPSLSRQPFSDNKQQATTTPALPAHLLQVAVLQQQPRECLLDAGPHQCLRLAARARAHGQVVQAHRLAAGHGAQQRRHLRRGAQQQDGDGRARHREGVLEVGLPGPVDVDLGAEVVPDGGGRVVAERERLQEAHQQQPVNGRQLLHPRLRPRFGVLVRPGRQRVMKLAPLVGAVGDGGEELAERGRQAGAQHAQVLPRAGGHPAGPGDSGGGAKG